MPTPAKFSQLIQEHSTDIVIRGIFHYYQNVHAIKLDLTLYILYIVQSVICNQRWTVFERHIFKIRIQIYFVFRI